jgi:hypothetical protein
VDGGVGRERRWPGAALAGRGVGRARCTLGAVLVERIAAFFYATGWLGFFAGPVLIGGTAELVGLPAALGIPVLSALPVALAAGALRPSATAPASRPPRLVSG